MDAGAPYKLQEILVRWDEEISTRDKINNRFLGVLMDATIDKIEIRAATKRTYRNCVS